MEKKIPIYVVIWKHPKWNPSSKPFQGHFMSIRKEQAFDSQKEAHDFMKLRPSSKLIKKMLLTKVKKGPKTLAI